MTLVPTPNGLLIASSLFALSGIALLAKSFLATAAIAESDESRQMRHAENRVASWFGLPMLGASAFLHGAGQMVSGPLGAGLTCLLLALALTLFVYAGMEGSLTDRLTGGVSHVSESDQPPRLLAGPPKLKAVEIRDVHDETEGTRQALPAE